MDPTPGLSNKVEVLNQGIQGHGWFAKEDIPKGEIIYWPRENSSFDFHVSEVLKWEPNRRRKFFKIAYQVDDEIYNGYHSDSEITEDQKLEWFIVRYIIA